MRIVQFSDTHLSGRHRQFAANAEVLRQHLAAIDRPDLFVNTGDLAMDGAGEVADLEFAAAWHEGLSAPLLAVPGNHDVGDRAELRPDQPVDDARLAAWRAHAGPDRQMRDRDGWRLIGLNAMLLGTFHAEEERQFAWLEGALDTSAPIALFLHKPLFIESPDEGPRGYWNVPPAPRARLLALLGAADVRLIASGHLHIHRQTRFGRAAHVWGPSGAFVCGESQEELGGQRLLGVIEHELAADGTVSSRFVRPEGFRELTIEPVVDEIYRKKQPA